MQNFFGSSIPSLSSILEEGETLSPLSTIAEYISKFKREVENGETLNAVEYLASIGYGLDSLIASDRSVSFVKGIEGEDLPDWSAEFDIIKGIGNSVGLTTYLYADALILVITDNFGEEFILIEKSKI